MSLPENIGIGIIGSGLMGTDIFYYLSDFDYNLVWVCLGEDERAGLQSAYERKADRHFRSGLIDEAELLQRKDRAVFSSALSDLKECGIIIEAIQENAADKARLFLELTTLISDEAIVVTNTSSIKPSLMVSDESLIKRFAGLHFFYPVKIKNIVELIATDNTSEQTLSTLREFTSAIGRFTLTMHEDEAFILNRLFLDLQAQAFRLHHDEGLDIKVLDAIIKKTIFPFGVFEFFDAVGIDVMRQSIINYTETMAGRDFYKPVLDCLDELIAQGRLGRKSGSGFYRYPDDGAPVQMPGSDTRERVSGLLMGMYVNAAFRALEKNLWSRDDLEFAVKEYMSVDKGPFTLAEEIGHEPIKELLHRYHDETGFEAYRPSWLL